MAAMVRCSPKLLQSTSNSGLEFIPYNNSFLLVFLTSLGYQPKECSIICNENLSNLPYICNVWSFDPTRKMGNLISPCSPQLDFWVLPHIQNLLVGWHRVQGLRCFAATSFFFQVSEKTLDLVELTKLHSTSKFLKLSRHSFCIQIFWWFMCSCMCLFFWSCVCFFLWPLLRLGIFGCFWGRQTWWHVGNLELPNKLGCNNSVMEMASYLTLL